VIVSQSLFFAEESPAEKGFHSQHGKKTRGHAQSRNLLGFLRVSRRREVIASAGGIEDRHAFKRLALTFEIPEVRRRDDVPIARSLAKGFKYDHQAIRIGERQRLQQRVVDHAKDGCVGANAQRQGQHRDDREARVSHQVPQTVTRVLKKSSQNGSHLRDYCSWGTKLQGLSEYCMSAQTQIGLAHSSVCICRMRLT
jgi:hypothetical protein